MSDVVNPIVHADELPYSNTSSGLTATDVQTAIDEVNTAAASVSVDFIVATSGDSLIFSTDGQDVLTATPA